MVAVLHNNSNTQNSTTIHKEKLIICRFFHNLKRPVCEDRVLLLFTKLQTEISNVKNDGKTSLSLKVLM